MRRPRISTTEEKQAAMRKHARAHLKTRDRPMIFAACLSGIVAGFGGNDRTLKHEGSNFDAYITSASAWAEAALNHMHGEDDAGTIQPTDDKP